MTLKKKFFKLLSIFFFLFFSNMCFNCPCCLQFFFWCFLLLNFFVLIIDFFSPINLASLFFSPLCFYLFLITYFVVTHFWFNSIICSIPYCLLQLAPITSIHFNFKFIHCLSFYLLWFILVIATLGLGETKHVEQKKTSMAWAKES